MELSFSTYISQMDSSAAVVEGETYYIEVCVNVMAEDRTKAVYQNVNDRKKTVGKLMSFSTDEKLVENYKKYVITCRIYVPKLVILNGIDMLMFFCNTDAHKDKVFQSPSRRDVGNISEYDKVLKADSELGNIKEVANPTVLLDEDYERIKMLVYSKF